MTLAIFSVSFFFGNIHQQTNGGKEVNLFDKQILQRRAQRRCITRIATRVLLLRFTEPARFRRRFFQACRLFRGSFTAGGRRRTAAAASQKPFDGTSDDPGVNDRTPAVPLQPIQRRLVLFSFLLIRLFLRASRRRRRR